MSEIINGRAWDHVHAESKQTEYFLDVHRVGAIEPDEWDFGTDRELRDAIAVLIHQRRFLGYKFTGLCHTCGQALYTRPSGS